MDTNFIFLSIVIPAYNESHRLISTLDNILYYLKKKSYSFEIIVIDDGSEDNTRDIVYDYLRNNPELRLICNDHRGKGFAVRTGMLAAQGSYILFTDADLATPICEIEKLLPFVLNNNYDIAIGSREGKGSKRLQEPFYRHLMGRVSNWFVRIIAIGEFQDTQCGFKLFRNNAAKDLFSLVEIFGDNTPQISGPSVTGFDVEVLFLALKHGYRIKEVPVQWHYRCGTKVNPVKDSFRLLRDVMLVRWNEIRGLYECKTKK